MKKNTFFKSIILLIIMLVISACAFSEKENNNNENDFENNIESEPEDVTLLWATENRPRYEDAKEAIEDKFSHITIEFYDLPTSRENIEEMLAEGIYPDMYDTYNAYKLPLFIESQLVYDMDDLIEKHNFDLDRIETSILTRTRSYAPNQELYGLPYEPDLLALFYNKDVFDLFGEEYPEDGITWEEVLELAPRLTAEHGGTEYNGFDLWDPFFAGEAYDITYVDPETDKPVFTDSDFFRKGLELFREIRQIPGNEPAFILEGHVAMAAQFKGVADGLLDVEEEIGLNWDMVSWPVFEDNPDIAPVLGGPVIGVSSTSEHKEQAFEAITYLLSDEHQIEQVRKGLSTPLSDPDLKSQIYADDPRAEDKNVEAFYYYPYNAGPEVKSQYDSVLVEFTQELVDDLAESVESIPEILKKYEELTETFIIDQKSLLED